MDSEASRVTIAVVATCQGEVYDQQGVQQLVTGAVTQQARKSLGAGYALQGSISTTGTQIATTEQAHGTLSLLVNAEGMWSYQFSPEEVNHLSTQIVGKSRAEALAILKRLPTLRTVDISETWGATTIPSDPAYIQVMVVSPLAS